MSTDSSQKSKSIVAVSVLAIMFLFTGNSIAEDVTTEVTDFYNENGEVSIVSEEVVLAFKMPTKESLPEGIEAYYIGKVSGTDAWNELIEKVATEENVDPVFVKCIMALESGGAQKTVNYNTNGTSDYGLMQVNTGWGSLFNYQRMLNEPEYAIRSGIKVIKYKIAAAERAGKDPTIFEVAWRYNGYNATGKKYANKFATLYEALATETTRDSLITANVMLINNAA